MFAKFIQRRDAHESSIDDAVLRDIIPSNESVENTVI